MSISLPFPGLANKLMQHLKLRPGVDHCVQGGGVQHHGPPRLGVDLVVMRGGDDQLWQYFLGAVHYTMLQAEDTWTPGHSPATGGGWGQHQH